MLPASRKMELHVLRKKIHVPVTMSYSEALVLASLSFQKSISQDICLQM